MDALAALRNYPFSFHILHWEGWAGVGAVFFSKRRQLLSYGFVSLMIPSVSLLSPLFLPHQTSPSSLLPAQSFE